VALRDIQVWFDTTQLPIDIRATRDGIRRKVVATADIPKETILIPPCASNGVHFLPTTSHPYAVKVTVDYSMRCAAGVLMSNTLNTSSALVAMYGGRVDSGNAEQSRTPAGADGVKSIQTVRDYQANSTATANVTGGEASDATSTADFGLRPVVYNKGDVLIENRGGREWTIEKVHDGSKLTLVERNTSTTAFFRTRPVTKKVHINDIVAKYRPNPVTAQAGEPVLQAPATLSAPPVGNTAYGNATSAGIAPRASDATQPNRPTDADLARTTRTFMLLPEFNAPQWLGTTNQSDVCMWTFRPDTSLHSFWAVRRLTASALAAENEAVLKKGGTAKTFNCRLTEFCLNLTVSGTIGEQSTIDTRMCTFWGITNSATIVKGSELLLQIADPTPNGGTYEPGCKRRKLDASAQAAIENESF